MKIGFFAVGIADTARPEMITAIATNAERLGFSTVWAPEHVVLLENFSSRYPYSGDGKIPIPTATPLLDPFIALTYAAAHTSRIRLATGICILPERNPLVLAKVAASLDYLSNGRFALGIGIGGWKRSSRRSACHGLGAHSAHESTLRRCAICGATRTAATKVNSLVSRMHAAFRNRRRVASFLYWWAARPIRRSSARLSMAMVGADST
jgi:hypothetical protein